METSPTAVELIRFLASTHRVVVLGGLAVISHGLSRVTHDADCWLEPNLSTELWCEAVKKILLKWPRLRMVSIGDWSELPANELAGYIEDFGILPNGFPLLRSPRKSASQRNRIAEVPHFFRATGRGGESNKTDAL